MMDSLLNPQVLGLLGMQLMQQGQPAGNNQAYGLLAGLLLPAMMGKTNSATQEEDDTAAQPASPQSAVKTLTANANQQNNSNYLLPASSPMPIRDANMFPATNSNPFPANNPSDMSSNDSGVTTPLINSKPANTMVSANLDPRRAGLLYQLRAAAMNAYPNSPTMQQVAITQAIQESGLMGAKPSQLASKYNNYFGIKGRGATLPTQEYYGGTPTAVNASFAANPSMQASFQQHAHLMGNKRYQPVMAASTPSDAFVALQRAGYATDPRYANKLGAVYNRYVQPLYP
jgi:flagellum-specific peptidoglycan hydrolase FlgJ